MLAMESHSCHVVCSVASTTDIDRGALKGGTAEACHPGVLAADRVAVARGYRFDTV
jgi:hypothetical protein